AQVAPERLDRRGQGGPQPHRRPDRAALTARPRVAGRQQPPDTGRRRTPWALLALPPADTTRAPMWTLVVIASSPPRRASRAEAPPRDHRITRLARRAKHARPRRPTTAVSGTGTS